MMIHFGYAPLAEPTMMCPRRLRYGALATPPTLRFDHLFREDIPARIDRHGLVICVPENEEQYVEDDGLGARWWPRVKAGILEEQLRKITKECDK